MRSVYRPSAIVEAWFDLMPPAQAANCRALMQAVSAASSELAPVVKWGQLIFLNNGHHAFAVAPFRRHVHFQVFNGSAVAHRFPMLRGSGPGLRHLRWRHGEPVDGELVTVIARAALAVSRW
jgi:hypothetical protein